MYEKFGIEIPPFHQLKGGDVNFIEPTKIPEILYFIAFSSIGWVLYYTVPNSSWLVPLAILSTFLVHL